MAISGDALALILIVAGVVAFILSWVAHWMLLVLAAILVVVGLYVLFTGAALPI